MISMLMFKVFLVCFTLNSCQTANEKGAEPTIVHSVEQEGIADSSPVVTDPIEATLSAKPENPIKEVIPPTDNSDSQRPNTKDPGSDLPITPGIEDTSNPENQEAKEDISNSNSNTPPTQSQVNYEEGPTETGHEVWDALLRKYVTTSGKVNYPGFVKDLDLLDEYLEYLSQNRPDLTARSNEALAYWLNAYNAYTIKLILDHYPVKSIRKTHNGEPWKVKWISLGGESFSLDQIENEIIRPGFKDARIHFAVNCAAKSCPPLHNEALTAQNVQAKLDSLTEAFINNGKFNLLEGDVRISRIFEWYQADFGILSRFINKYAQKKIPENVVPGYLEYDWALNE